MSNVRKKTSSIMLFQDVVEQVVQQLRKAGIKLVENEERSTDNNLVRSTQEALRLLQTRVPVGRLGKSDRQETRVAALLDHVIRRGHLRSKKKGGKQECLDLKKVATAMRVRFKDFQQLHSIIGNYDYDLHQGKQKQVPKKPIPAPRLETGNLNTTTKKRSLTEALEQRRSQRPRRSLDCQSLLRSSSESGNQNSTSNSILPDLIIRLSVYIRDAASMLPKTQNAMKDLVQYAMQQCTAMSASERRGHEYDLHRYWPAYQAAMLFYMVTFSDQTSKTAAAASGNNNNPSASEQNYDEETYLTMKLEDLCEASSAFTFMEVKEKLPFIKQWARDRQREKDVQDSRKGKKRTEKGNKARGDASATKPNRESKNTQGDVTFEENDVANGNEKESTSFQEWKEHILQEACRDAATQKEFDPDVSTKANNDTALSRSHCLQLAADNVLRKYGIL